ncbi:MULTISPECIES: glycoside hydrolase family 105 protein [unclassified Pedobacter]|uniref:glycoside hydrolase family 88/105 protein n=1 Tax=unclassified Pedobacter TaxID=2628915 RepID=UPI001DECC265|nr:MULTISPECIES: glycoside hydrolase family 88 protein [unclassified Pedobacter]CAH0133112.1 Unsaturated rhamnogalacturonyl hydrolase YteR [Pedobacter sp. Bi126]CAH0225313.1 Unsaturated rhamnogalacturonyl hydrolase YteR [Pedobacter sp. Bi36]
MKKNITVILGLLIGFPFIGFSQSADLKKWPKGVSSEEIGTKVAARFVATPHTNFNKSTPPRVITYAESCAWYGALKFAKASADRRLKNDLIKRFEPMFKEEAGMIPPVTNVDYAVFGSIPLQLFIQTGDKKYKEMGQSIADKQWAMPDSGVKVSPVQLAAFKNGYTWHTRMWIDDMFMITALQAQAYRATKDEKYINRAAKEMVLYLDSLQKPNGLFYHAPDVPFFWARGNGWMAAGMAEILSSLPANNPDRPRIIKGYQTMMSALLAYQAPSGMWRQLIDEPSSWEESSSTGMFAYAMVVGVKKGWLNKEKYAPAARKAWLGLVSCLDENGDVKDVCEGTNKKNDKQYYLDRKRIVGDMHGQAPILWTAAALID